MPVHAGNAGGGSPHCSRPGIFLIGSDEDEAIQNGHGKPLLLEVARAAGALRPLSVGDARKDRPGRPVAHRNIDAVRLQPPLSEPGAAGLRWLAFVELACRLRPMISAQL